MPIFCELVDRLLFGQHRLAIPLQTAVQHLIRGPRPSEFILRHGPAKGLRFACLTSEKYFFERANFEYTTGCLLRKIVKSGWVVYDVGGHIGYWALILSRLCGERGRVFVFEPSSVNFNRLRANIESNDLSNATAFNLAASDQNGTASFSEQGSMSSIVPDSKSVVQAVRLDSFMRSGPAPDLMLVDVEGHAGQVFCGAGEILRNYRPHLIYEIHNGAEARNADNVLLPLGYIPDPLGRRTRFPLRYHAVAPRSH